MARHGDKRYGRLSWRDRVAFWRTRWSGTRQLKRRDRVPVHEGVTIGTHSVGHADRGPFRPVTTVAEFLGRKSGPSTARIPALPGAAEAGTAWRGYAHLARGWPVAAVIGAAVIAVALLVRTPSSPATNVARLELSTSQVRLGDTYLATATNFTPGEGVRFSWTGPTYGVMGTSAADSAGGTAHGPILEKDPPGDYTITATGLSSGHTDSAALRILVTNPPPTP